MIRRCRLTIYCRPFLPWLAQDATVGRGRYSFVFIIIFSSSSSSSYADALIVVVVVVSTRRFLLLTPFFLLSTRRFRRRRRRRVASCCGAPVADTASCRRRRRRRRSLLKASRFQTFTLAPNRVGGRHRRPPCPCTYLYFGGEEGGSSTLSTVGLTVDRAVRVPRLPPSRPRLTAPSATAVRRLTPLQRSCRRRWTLEVVSARDLVREPRTFSHFAPHAVA